MRRFWIAILALALSGGLAAAQEGDGGDQPPPGDQPRAGDQAPQQQQQMQTQGPSEGGAQNGEGGDGGGQAEAPKTITLDDARSNVTTLIQSFIAQRSADGAWPLVDKRTKKVRRLRLVKVDEKKVRSAGNQIYAAPATLKDIDSTEQLQAVFKVDFSGSEWKVVGMRLSEPERAKRKATAR